MIYYFVLGALSLSALRPNRSNPGFLYYFSLVGLFLFSAFRFEVGCDWPNYLLNYYKQLTLDFRNAATSANPSHWLVLEMMSQLQLPYYFLNVFTSAVFFFGLHRIALTSGSPAVFVALAYPVLVINMPMAAVKQAAAIGLVCVAFVYFLNRRGLRFVVLVVAAFTFHGSAIVFLAATPFATGSYSLKRVFAAGLVSIPGILLFVNSEAAGTATERYIVGDGDAAGAIYRVGALFLTGMIFLTCIARSWKITFPETYALLNWSSIAMVCLAALLPVSTVIADRFGYYLVIPQLLIFAGLCRLPRASIGFRFRKLPVFGLAILFIIWSRYSSHFQSCYLPYQFSWH